MIDIDTGMVSFDDGFIVKPQLDVVTAASFPGVRRAPTVGARTQFSAGVHPSGKNNWGVGLVYENDRLVQVWLQWLDQKETDHSADWNLQNEKTRKVIHDRLVIELCENRGKKSDTSAALTYIFSWGKVSSVLDLRGVQALIVLEHAE